MVEIRITDNLKINHNEKHKVFKFWNIDKFIFIMLNENEKIKNLHTFLDKPCFNVKKTTIDSPSPKHL